MKLQKTKRCSVKAMMLNKMDISIVITGYKTANFLPTLSLYIYRMQAFKVPVFISEIIILLTVGTWFDCFRLYNISYKRMSVPKCLTVATLYVSFVEQYHNIINLILYRIRRNYLRSLFGQTNANDIIVMIFKSIFTLKY